jgi:hypothetical protein
MAVIKGADKGTFGVDDMLTRGEMTAMIEKATAAASASPDALLGNVVSGDAISSSDRFATRGMFAEAVWKAFELASSSTGNGEENFRGRIDPAHRYAKVVSALDSLGILDLYKGGFFPARPITRGEAAEILMKAMTVK